MEDSRIHDARQPLNSAQADAEKILRDAETREARSPDGEEKQEVRETTSSYLGMSRKEGPPVAGEPPVATEAREPSTVPVGDKPAPLSSLLGIPTLVKRSEASTEDKNKVGAGETGMVKSDTYVSSGLGIPLLSDNPTPLSSALHIPTLINESKPSRER